MWYFIKATFIALILTGIFFLAVLFFAIALPLGCFILLVLVLYAALKEEDKSKQQSQKKTPRS